MGRARLTLGLTALACALAACAASTAEGYVYWANNGPGSSGTGTTLGRANLDGGGVNHSLVTVASAPFQIALDAAHIYWTGGHESIGIANLDGSGANPSLIPNATTGSEPNGIAVDAAHVYWSDGNRYIGRADLDGKHPQPHFIDFGSSFYPSGIAVSSGNIYAAGIARVESVPVSGGTPSTVVTLNANTTLTAVAVAGGYVYWSGVDFSKKCPCGAIGRALLGGGSPDAGFIPNLTFPTGVGTDGTELYWVDHTPGTIGRALLGSSGATNIQTNFLSDPGGPSGVAVDALIDPTQTSVSCTPTTVSTGSASSCQATVTDSASSAAPTGSVVFASNATTFFSSSSCTLTPQPGGGASCVVGAVPTNGGSTPITASYGGDAVHGPSSASTSICASPSPACPAATAPQNNAWPTIPSVAAVGQTLYCSQGSWSGTAPISFSYEWLRDGIALPAAAASSYRVAAADAGHALTCRVTATNSVGSTSALSAPVNVPRPTGPPRASTATAGRATAGPGNGVKVGVSCAGPAGSGCTITLRLTVLETLRGRHLLALSAAKQTKRVVNVGMSTVTLKAGQHRTVTIALNSLGRKLRSTDHKLKVKLTIDQLAGAHSTPISVQTLAFKAPAKKKR